MLILRKTIAIFTVCLIGLLIGCQADLKQDNTNNNVSEMNYTNEKEPNDTAKHLVDLASSVPDVNDATAIVIGQYAIVGIDVNKDLDRSRVGTVKYTVGEALKNDPNGADAIVTADLDLNERLKRMRNDMQEGRPVAGIMEELAEIVNRIMPETPDQLIEDDARNPERKNDQQLDGKEKQKIKQEQEKQDLDR